MRCLALSLFALAACARMPPLYTTPCGLEVVELAPSVAAAWSLADVARLEYQALTAYDTNVDEPDFKFDAACRSLSGTQVHVLETNDLKPGDDKTTWGQTWCVSSSIYLVAETPTASSLAHEIAHIVEGCAGEHWRWGERGIKAAIDSVRGEMSHAH